MSIDKEFDINALACEYGKYYKITRQEDESDSAYRSRVAGELRRQGHIIEAHEAFSGRRYDDPEQGPSGAMTGIFGAVVQKLQGTEYSPDDPERQIGDDIAVGAVVRYKDNNRDSALSSLFDILGPSDGMDFLDPEHKRNKK